MDNIKITNLPDGGAIVEDEDEVIVYTAEEIDEMERDYKNAIRRLLEKEVKRKWTTKQNPLQKKRK